MKITELAIAFSNFTTTVLATPTANRVLTLPNTTGTLATIADIPPRQWREVVTGAMSMNITRSPDITRPVSVIVNGQHLSRELGDFSVSGLTITILTGAGFLVDATDSVLVEYFN